VSADGAGIVSHAGALLLTETARVTGLQAGLPAALGRWRAPRAMHDPGKIVLDLAVAVALGGDCLADIGVLRAQPGLFGPVASDPVVSRLVTQLAADAPAAMTAIGKARSAARERAWKLAGDAAPGTGGGLIPVDIDATIVTVRVREGERSCDLEEDVRPAGRVRRPRHRGGRRGAGHPAAARQCRVQHRE
jgi:Transposase DDE domain group 1